MNDIFVMPKGWDIYCIGRDYKNNYWNNARHIDSGELHDSFSIDIPHKPTIRELVYAAAEAIEEYENEELQDVQP